MITKEQFEKIELQYGCGYWHVCDDHACGCSPSSAVGQGFNEEVYSRMQKQTEEQKQALEKESDSMDIFDEQKCRICGCTWDTPCEGGCYWVEEDLCSKCAENLEKERIQKLINEAPDFCPITGLQKIESYIFDEDVVYGTKYPYDAYTLPVYDPESKSFSRIKIDMDDDFRRDEEWLCDLDDLKDREDYLKIKEFYDIA